MFAERLKMARKAKKYSQAEVSRLLGVTQQAVGKWETGRSTPFRLSFIPDSGRTKRGADTRVRWRDLARARSK